MFRPGTPRSMSAGWTSTRAWVTGPRSPVVSPPPVQPVRQRSQGQDRGENDPG
jgi:hypothetical protein